MLRDILRRHPHLDAPEETHFFRLGEPYGTPMYEGYFTRSVVLRKHREMDGISEPEFAQMLSTAISRADLCRRYMSLFLERRKPTARRWFDKTPQNVYGAAQIAQSFPRARFVHIVRDPLDVVASLRIGKVMKVENLVGACNYWTEAVQTMRVLCRAFPERVYEFRYEDFAAAPLPELRRILEFLGEPFDPTWFSGLRVERHSHDSARLFTADERRRVAELCGVDARPFGYLPVSDREACEPTQLPPLAEAIEQVQLRLAAITAPPEGVAPIPRILMQYWDREPPSQVAALIERNRALSAGNGVQHRLFDDDSARAYLREWSPPQCLAAYDMAPHAAMKSDLFRLCFLFREGGYYLDSDMVLREGFAELFDTGGPATVFVWNSHDRRNVCNWLIGATPGAALIKLAMHAACDSIRDACVRNRQDALRNILGVSGPGLLTRAVAYELARTPHAASSALTMRSVEFAYTKVQNGPEFLRQKLEYKSTERHWEVAARNA